jgi:hypothetical protein
MIIPQRRGARVAGRTLARAQLLGVLLDVAPVPERLSTPARTATGDLGFAGVSTSDDGSAVTGEKPESKLWWKDGVWWAALVQASSQTDYIFRLDRSSQQWADTGTMIDNRPKTRADVLWDGNKLYVSSHVHASASAGATSGRATGVVVMASNDVIPRYWHADLPLGSP